MRNRVTCVPSEAPPQPSVTLESGQPPLFLLSGTFFGLAETRFYRRGRGGVAENAEKKTLLFLAFLAFLASLR